MVAEARDALWTYYRENGINPVPICLENEDDWDVHLAKRYNLYQKHLGISVSLLKGCSVLEFGCNSGENALVHAMAGANLTLVEPNEQVFPRLKRLFDKYNVSERIVALIRGDVEGFRSKELYDLVIAEGFLFTLRSREKALKKIIGHVRKRGLGIISFNDRYGSLLEVLKRFLLKRACELESVDVKRSKRSLELAWILFGSDFCRINASRPFAAWWEDGLVTPFFAYPTFWTYKDILRIIENMDCEMLSTSPQWHCCDVFRWYKDVRETRRRHEEIMDEWVRNLPYFVTGLAPPNMPSQPILDGFAESLSLFISTMSDYTTSTDGLIESVCYPSFLDRFFKDYPDSRIRSFNEEIKTVLEVAQRSNSNELVRAYHETEILRKSWGTPYHYISFIKWGG